MSPEDAVAIACDRCVTAASLLAAACLPASADDRSIGGSLAAGVVSGWADATSVGSADAAGIIVRDRSEGTSVRVRWTQIAAAIRPGLHEPGVAERLTDVYERYVAAATATSVAARLEARAASAELAQLRRDVIARGRDSTPLQLSLFPPPPNRGRSLA